MARGDYGPEIRTSLGDSTPGRKNLSPPKPSPADMARDKVAGIKEGSPQDQKLDAMPRNQARAPVQPPTPRIAPPMGNPVANQGMPPDAHHVAAATSIAHAILGNRGM
jgi:hypothetical protein